MAKPGDVARTVLVPGDRTGRRTTSLLPIGDVFALFGAVDRWFPLDLDLGPTETAKLLTEQFRPRFTSKAFRSRVEMIASMPSQILQLAADRVTMVQAWTLLGSDGSELDPIAVAWACTVPHPAACTPGEFVDLLLPDISADGDLRLYQPMDLQPLDTPLGQAHRVRARFASDTPHGLIVQEAIRIFWLFPGEEVALVFQTPPSTICRSPPTLPVH